MSDCPSTGGVHAFVLEKSTTDAEGRQTTFYRCQCGAQQSITGPSESRRNR
jgi:hypothetical protein